MSCDAILWWICIAWHHTNNKKQPVGISLMGKPGSTGLASSGARNFDFTACGAAQISLAGFNL
jgi:hypothetical protein